MNNQVTANKDIRALIERSGVKMWQIAAKLGIHHATLSVWMRFEMDDERKAQIREAIEEIEGETA